MTDIDLRDGQARPEPPRVFVRRRRSLALAALVLLCVLQALWVAIHVLAEKTAFTWDPSHHSMWGWLIWSDVATGHWLSFLYDTYRQVYWPPVHSWLLGAAMLVLGPSVFTTGLVSLVTYSAAGVLLGVLAAKAERRHALTAGAVATGLWLTAGNLVNRYATQPFTEMPAVAVTAGAMLLLVRALERGTPAAWAWAGVAAMATYLTKTDYGIILILATLSGSVLSARARGGPTDRRGLLAWALAIAVLAGMWFAFPPKIPATIGALVNREQGPPTLSVRGLAYHFGTLVDWTDGFLVWALCLAAFAASVLAPRTDLVRIVLAYVAIAFLLHTVSQTKDVKHIVKVVPWLFLLAGVQAARLRALAEGSPRRGAVIGLLTLALVAGGFARAADFVRKTHAPPPTGAAALPAAVAERIRPGRSHVVIGAFGACSPHAVSWALVGADPGARIVPDPMTKTGYTREAFHERIAELRRRVRGLGLLEPDWDGPVHRVAFLMPRGSREERTDPREILERMERFEPDRILVVALEPGSTWNTPDYRDFIHAGAAFVRPLSARADFGLTEVLEIPEHRVRVYVFDRAPGRAGRDRPSRQPAVRHVGTALRHPAAAVRHGPVHSVPLSG
ncbi:MAG TPA: glycosyltransferase family 39 protein [Gemmatimonadota bacterium]